MNAAEDQPTDAELQTTEPASAPARRRRHPVAVALLFVLFLIVVLELTLHVFYLAAFGRVFPFASYNAAIDRLADSAPDSLRGVREGEGIRYAADRSVVEVIHPYLGWVVDPYRTPNTSEIGLHDPQTNILESAPEGTLTVAVLGGSFARQLTTIGRPFLEEELAKTGRPVRIVSLATGAFKQPQQVNLLSWILSLGARPDLVINVDGYNEAALGIAMNSPTNTSPLYPSAWYYRVANLSDQESLRRMGKVEVLRGWRAEWAATIRAVPLRWSIARCGLWRAVDKPMQLQILRERVRSVTPGARGRRSYLLQGPDLVTSEPARLHPFLADHWADCSLQMDAIARAHGARYLHALQPNQYDDGSKPLTEEERRDAFDPDEPTRIPVRDTYPLLRARGADLATSGVRFLDLSMIFKDDTRTLYSDACCHLNAEGYEAVCRRIGAEAVVLLSGDAISTATAADSPLQ